MWPFRKHIVNVDGQFRVYCKTAMERYRVDTFWTKEPETLVWLSNMCPNAILIDVGANVGMYSLYAGANKHFTQVYALEPMLENYSRLVDNVLLNGRSNVHPFNMAMGKHTTMSKFYVKEAGVGKSGSQLYSPKDENKKSFVPEREQRIMVTTFDDFVDNLPLRPIYLKVDVDGHEMSVLEGIKRHGCRLEGVLVEVNTDMVSISEVSALMKRHRLLPDAKINKMRPHSSERRGGNPVNVVYAR